MKYVAFLTVLYLLKMARPGIVQKTPTDSCFLYDMKMKGNDLLTNRRKVALFIYFFLLDKTRNDYRTWFGLVWLGNVQKTPTDLYDFIQYENERK